MLRFTGVVNRAANVWGRSTDTTSTRGRSSRAARLKIVAADGRKVEYKCELKGGYGTRRVKVGQGRPGTAGGLSDVTFCNSKEMQTRQPASPVFSVIDPHSGQRLGEAR